MSLNLDWKECKSERVRQDPFNAGICLMSIGVNEVTPKNERDAEMRLRISEVIFGDASGYSASDLIGLKSNVTPESLTKWIHRMRKAWSRV